MRPDVGALAAGVRPWTRALLLSLLVVLTAGCQLSLAADVDVDRDGGGRLELAVAVDEELRTELQDLGVDPTLGLEEATAAATGWDVETNDDDGALEVRFRTTFDRPEELAVLVEDFQASLDDEDAALLRDVELGVDDDGASRFRATAGLRLPTTPGVTGTGVAFDGEDLADLVAEQGDRLVRYDLRVTLPGPVRSSDADERDGRSLTWHLPVGDMRSVQAEADAPGQDWILLGAVALGAALVAGVLVTVIRRRRAARRERSSRIRRFAG